MKVSLFITLSYPEFGLFIKLALLHDLAERESNLELHRSNNNPTGESLEIAKNTVEGLTALVGVVKSPAAVAGSLRKLKSVGKMTIDGVTYVMNKSGDGVVKLKPNSSWQNSQRGSIDFRSNPKGIYDPKTKRADVEATDFSKNTGSTDQVNSRFSSRTVPKKAHQARVSRDDVITDANGNRAVKLTLDDGSIKHIPYDNRNLPIFDDVTVFTTKIDHNKSHNGQMKQASKDMWEAIKGKPVEKSKFTQRQLDDMKAGMDKIDGFTWHHNAQSAPSNMQLLPFYIHKSSSVPHTGENSLKQGR